MYSKNLFDIEGQVAVVRGGRVTEIFCYSDTLSNFEIKTEDTAEILLRLENRA